MSNNRMYEIKVEGLKYGKVKKELVTDYRSAVSEYVDIQRKFAKINCEVTLNEVKINQSGKKERKLQYRNYLGKDYALEEKLRQLAILISEIQEIQEYHKATSYEGTADFNDVRHAIENGMAQHLTPEQCKEVFLTIGERAAIRRASKIEMDKFKANAHALNNIKCQINKCLDTCKKIDISASTEKAKENAKVSDQKYLDTLLELCDEGRV